MGKVPGSLAAKPRAILVVTNDVESEWEQDLNDWYEQEHIPQRLAFPGFLGARRFALADVAWPGQRWQKVAQGRKYITIYELESRDALLSPEYTASYDDITPWSKRVNPHMCEVTRSVYELLLEVSPDS